MARGKSTQKTPVSPLLELQQRFAALPPFELLGSQLLDRKTQGFAITTEALVAASIDAVEYSKRCQQTAERLSDLPATPAALDCPEFGL